MQNTISFIHSNGNIKNTKTDLLIFGLFEGEKFDDRGQKEVSEAISLESFKGKYRKKVFVYGDNIKRTIVVGLGKKEDYSSLKAREIGATIANYSNQLDIAHIFLDGQSLELSNKKLSQPLFEGVILGNYQFLNYKTIDSKNNSLEKISVLGKYNKDSQKLAFSIADSVNYARDLGNHPANILTPTYLANESKRISKAKNMKCTIFDVSKFQKMGLGSFYGVARGAKEPAKMIIVEYNGGSKTEKPIALVGKGLTFDTGGISLKPGARMDEMKFDMCGSATVMGLMNAVSILQPKVNIIFAIGSTENMPGSDAQRPGDIVTAYNGKTIEVLNTDAEGRLVLADVLSYVDKNYNPKFMIDFATLTGAVLVALGHRASGLMGNDEKLINQIKKSSEVTDEKVWELPLWPEYSRDIKGKYADIQNLGKAGAGTITAGAFLKEFVGDTPWCHLDIAGTAWGPKEPGYQPKVGATGVAVRLIYHLIEN
tara:strand:- start:33434 stop:34882 length:1449 start_codon:yes stop_codon:yes gene_type:complete